MGKRGWFLSRKYWMQGKRNWFWTRKGWLIGTRTA
jgi:hypothetical protein